MPLRRLAIPMLLALVACRRARPPAEAADPAATAEAATPPRNAALEPLEWTSYAQDGATLVSLAQTATTPTHCRLTARRGADLAWTAEACVARRGSVRYLSPNGDSLLVLEASPEVEGPLLEVGLGALYQRGQLVRRYTVSEVLHSSTGFPVDAGKLRWLGDAEATVDTAGVQLRLADGRGERFAWDGTGIANLAPRPVARGEAAPAQRNCAGGCSYVDERGDVHFVDNAEDIPAKLSGRAHALRGANLNTMAATALPTTPPAVEIAVQPTPRELEQAWKLQEGAAAARYVPPPPEKTVYQHAIELGALQAGGLQPYPQVSLGGKTATEPGRSTDISAVSKDVAEISK